MLYMNFLIRIKRLEGEKTTISRTDRYPLSGKALNIILLKTFKCPRSLYCNQDGISMEQMKETRNVQESLITCGICFFFICISSVPTLAISTQNHDTVFPYTSISTMMSDGDIPTWYLGDTWSYTINPLSFSSPNGTFTGSIHNFRQTVTGITDGTYTIHITGDLTGVVTVPGFSGDLTGEITGTSYFRVSDLAEISTAMNSQGTITYMMIPFPYEMSFYTNSSPALETYDFPLRVGETWQLGSYTTAEGSFSILGVYEQSFNESQWVDETVACTQQEQISVPAGTFVCYQIGRETSQNWYATDAGNIVKSIVNQTGENMSVHLELTLQSYSFGDQPITISEIISPSVVAPGASVTISGQAIFTSSGSPVQNGMITIEIPSTGASWSSTTNSAGYYSQTINAPTIHDDTPCGRETGSGGVLVHCSSGSLNGYRVHTLTTIQDTAPAAPSVQGQTEGKPKVSYPYTIGAVDPEGDEISYYVDWGDMTNLSWFGPYPSGQSINISHTYAKKGSYTIKVQARDFYYATSGWGTLDVTMPFSFNIPYQSFLERFFERFPNAFPLLQHMMGS